MLQNGFNPSLETQCQNKNSRLKEKSDIEEFGQTMPSSKT